MSKLVDKAKKSKLKDSISNGNKPVQERIVSQIRPKDYPRSYRLDSEIVNILKNTLDKVNEISLKKVSEARLIKALIFLSTEIEEEKLLKALKEVW